MPLLGENTETNLYPTNGQTCTADDAGEFEPVAIVGMGCRWPGELTEPGELWNFLQRKKDAYSEFPSNRINVDAFYHENRGRPGSFYSRGGCFLKSPKDFDHTFFGINPQEAASVDPAQRKLLETVYEAFESSGTTLEHVSGSKVGCFVGNFNYDHQLMQYRDAEYPESYGISGGGLAILSNRINYVFNLKGPSMTLDTACSSSMYALHLACSAIHAGDCSSAIVAGSNLILTPECQIFSSILGAVSPSSRCHTFDKAADGYARADGVGALYIKKLEDAIIDRDPIRAVIRSTAINANGKTGGITRPSSSGQESVIRQAYSRASLAFSTASYFECHGTGTPVGDPLEVAAIGNLFSEDRSVEDPLLIGSVKTNLGHSEPVSGIAGMMKVILALENDFIPPSIGIVNINPELDLRDGSLKIITENTPWPNKALRIASVNSFGYGGANAHVILEATGSFFANSAHARLRTSRLSDQSAPATMIQMSTRGLDVGPVRNGTEASVIFEKTDKICGRAHYLLPFSAHNTCTLKSNVEAIGAVVGNFSIVDLAYTLGARRSQLAERSFIVANENTLKKSIVEDKQLTYRVSKGQVPKLAFIFTGQGAQWPQMGLSLIETFPSCRQTLATLDRFLQELEEPPDWKIEEKIRDTKNPEDINKAVMAQPLTTAIQIVLIDLLRAWHVLPEVCMGHSSGEIAAAYGSGYLTSQEAIVLAYVRGKTMQYNTRRGSMLAVAVGEQQLKENIESDLSDIVVACYNSPNSITLSGEPSKIQAVKSTLKQKGILTRLLSTDGNAYHSPHMEDLGGRYEEDILRCCPNLNQNRLSSTLTTLISSVTSHRYSMLCTPASYWRKNLESPVKFEQALTRLLETVPVDLLLELGPHSALRGPINETCKSVSSAAPKDYVPTMTRNEDSVQSVLKVAGELWVRNLPLDLQRVNALEPVDHKDTKSRPVILENAIKNLPRYQWQYEETLLIENRWTREWRLRRHPRHDILGSQVPGGTKTCMTWRNVLRLQDVNWLSDHRIDNAIVFPAAGFMAMAIEATTQSFEDNGGEAHGIQCYKVENLTFEKALVIPQDDHGVEMFLVLTPVFHANAVDGITRFDFIVSSISNVNGLDTSTNHSFGQIAIIYSPQAVTDPMTWSRTSCTKWKSSSALWYKNFARVGLNYGPLFQQLCNLRFGDSTAVANLGVKRTFPGESRYAIHPTTLDSALQLCVVAAHAGQHHALTTPFLPQTVRLLELWPYSADVTNGNMESTAHSANYGIRGIRSDLTIMSQDQTTLRASDILFLSPQQSNASLIRNKEPFSRMMWIPDIDGLNIESVRNLYPLVDLGEAALSPQLDLLALHQLVQFSVEYAEQLHAGSKVPHLQNFLDWTKQRLDLAHRGHYPQSQKVLAFSLEDRASEIQVISDALMQVSSEARLSCHIYKNLPAILRGEKTGIQVALEDDRLSAMYKDAHRVSEGNRRLAEIMTLAANKNPNVEILEVGAGTGSATYEILTRLKGDTIHRMYKKYAFTDITPSFLNNAEDRFHKFQAMTYFTFNLEDEVAADKLRSSYDIIVASNAVHASSNILQTLRNLRRTLKSGGKMILLELTEAALVSGLLLGTFSDFWKGQEDPNFVRHGGPFLSKAMWKDVLPRAGFSGLDFYLDDYEGQASSTVIVATAVDNESSQIPFLVNTPREFTILIRGEPSSFALALRDHAQFNSTRVDVVSLAEDDCRASKHLVVLLELETPFFGDMSATEWTKIQDLLKNAKTALWITHGDLLTGRGPQYAMINGIACGIRTEMTRLRLLTVDFGEGTNFSCLETKNRILELADRCLVSPSHGHDMELRIIKGVPYFSRLMSDSSLNTRQRVATQHNNTIDSVPFQDPSEIEWDIIAATPGVLQSLIFQEADSSGFSDADTSMVEIDVRALGFSSENVAGLLGKTQYAIFNDECAGDVKQVGSSVKNLVAGDKVYSPVFGKCSNRAVVPASWCQKMRRHDSYEEMSKISVAFCTALRALQDLAHLVRGETVLVHSATSAIGFASLQIASLCGAQMIATVDNSETKAALLALHSYLAAERVFVSSDRSLTSKVLGLTNGRGVDVVISNLPAEIVGDQWDCLAPNGRFINLQRSDDIQARKCNMKVPCQDVSYMAFDLCRLSKMAPHEIASLMGRVQALRTQGLIKPLPTQIFHASKVEAAFAACLEHPLSSNVALTLDKAAGVIEYQKPTYYSRFDSKATYLLVGCLSDLGQIFSQWMVERGAKHLTFFSRSGCINEETQNFLTDLHARGVETDTLHGDVASLNDVKRAVAACRKPIKGVVQGALALKDRLFENLTYEMFDAVTKPRVAGTINLHNALDGEPLDFFLMWSSWTAIFGTATQSNYLATCSFMDAFARYRRSLGLPATSLNLSQIFETGAIKRVPSYATSLTRNGLYGNDPHEFIHFCDAAIASSNGSDSSLSTYDPLAGAQLLAGIEAAGLRDLDKTHPLEGMPWYHDPRFSHLIKATKSLEEARSEETVKPDLAETGLTVSERILKKLSQLLYVAEQDIDMTRSITTYGIDSMVAAELRNWLFVTFATDVSLFDMLDADTSVLKLEQMVIKEH